MKAEENGSKPAFGYVVPKGIGTEHSPYTSGVVPGLTKREYFAAMAMQGALGGEPGSHLNPDQLAKDSVQHADALLKELESKIEKLYDNRTTNFPTQKVSNGQTGYDLRLYR